ncbi:hypothetical protein ACFE04_031210 [Oxalis oulophora]
MVENYGCYPTSNYSTAKNMCGVIDYHGARKQDNCVENFLEHTSVDAQASALYQSQLFKRKVVISNFNASRTVHCLGLRRGTFWVVRPDQTLTRQFRDNLKQNWNREQIGFSTDLNPMRIDVESESNRVQFAFATSYGGSKLHR